MAIVKADPKAIAARANPHIDQRKLHTAKIRAAAGDKWRAENLRATLGLNDKPARP